MAVQIYTNNASTTLTGSIIATDLILSVADASAFPSPAAGQYFLITLELGSSREVVKVTSRSGNTLTVASTADRGLEGTTAAPWAPGSVVEVRVTKDTLARFARYEDLLDAYASSVYAPGTSAFTSGSVLFAGTDGRLKQDNTNLLYTSGSTLLTVNNLTVTTLLKALTHDSGAASPIAFKTNSGTQQFSIGHIASAVNYLQAKGGVTGTGGVLESVGAGTDIDILISPKGAGLATFTTTYGYTGIISPTQINANTNNYAPTSNTTASIIRINTDAVRTITGFNAGVSGRVVTFINIGSFAINFTNDDASSTAANRFKLSSPTVVIPPNGAISFWYDTTQARWVGLSSPSTSADVIQTLTDAATVNWDVSNGGWGVVTIAGNRLFGAPTNLLDGKEYVLFVIQDGTGSRIPTWNAVFKWSLGAAPVLSTGPGAIDMFSFKSRGGNLYGGFLKGMA